jgi:murein DD-endopeptidase MepM/ murein hydrolase activator NlpD
MTTIQDVINSLRQVNEQAKQLAATSGQALAEALDLISVIPVPPRPLFNWPVGTPDERIARWPGKWVDATGYCAHYQIRAGVWQYHTGCDFNLNYPTFDSDAHQPVYACSDGQVVYAGKGTGTWGNLVVIEHTLADDTLVWSRYAHLESYRVTAPMPGRSQLVRRGDEIARIGNAGGSVPYHLHFDSATGVDLSKTPSDWPGNDQARVMKNYADPKLYIQESLGYVTQV